MDVEVTLDVDIPATSPQYLFYSGISVGSVQDFGPRQATGNVIEYNHIHDIGQGI